MREVTKPYMQAERFRGPMARSAVDPLLWDARVDRGQISYELSERARNEAAAFVRAAPGTTHVTDLAIDRYALPHLREELENCRQRVDAERRLILLGPLRDLDFHERRMFAWIVANVFGEPLVQNKEGDRLVAVYARPGTKRLADGARYHQTREGGAPHTDNVNIPDLWEYLVFSCIRPARIGGESILLSAFSVHQTLVTVPEALEILRQPFWWEYRGISDELYQAPVITYNEAGEPRFRYLRRYLESAHERAGEPLTASQRWALDTLDAVLDLSHLQFRTTLAQGEILITYDSQVLHARTCFSEPLPGAPRDLGEAAAGPYRFFDRVWARKRQAA